MPLQNLEVTANKVSTLVTIRGAMTVVQVNDVAEVLLNVFAIEKKVELCLANVTEVDLAGLQLLCTAHRTSRKKGVPISIVGRKPAALAWAV
ncbi:STAS domain-containing protein [Geomonas agri]|uniref:STAS domain-containing protein n=1 Tax=Geomonas agri TaxID=2873702 RepID=UPI001CD1E0B6|nr:STAS domain-containing protein [Geomonas agri]